MSLLPSLLLFVLLALQLQRFCCEERRTDVMRAVLSGPAEPGFWPSRGRRADGSSEEQPPPFWAHRGRELAPCPGLGAQGLFAQEPKYLLVQRRDDQEPLWVPRGRKRSAEQ